MYLLLFGVQGKTLRERKFYRIHVRSVIIVWANLLYILKFSLSLSLASLSPLLSHSLSLSVPPPPLSPFRDWAVQLTGPFSRWQPIGTAVGTKSSCTLLIKDLKPQLQLINIKQGFAYAVPPALPDARLVAAQPIGVRQGSVCAHRETERGERGGERQRVSNEREGEKEGGGVV